MRTGHDPQGSFIVIRMKDVKKGHVSRVHNLVEAILSEEFGKGDREV